MVMNWFKNWGKKKTDATPENQESEMDFLKRINYSDVDFFHLRGYNNWAKVVKVYDGDTITVVMFLNQMPFKFRVRLSDIDTAEKKSKDEMEVKWANRAITRINELIKENKLVYLDCQKWDKYGRLLAQVYESKEKYLEDQNNQDCQLSINQKLQDEGLAYKYDGGERQKFRDWAPWAAWLEKPDYKEDPNTTPIDNIGDSEPLNTRGETGDFKKESNVATKKNKLIFQK